MNKCLNTYNLLTYISEFLTYKSILQLSLCNKFIYNSLNPEKNYIINNIYMRGIIEEFFQFEEDDNIFKNNKNLLGKFLKNRTNWKNFLKEIKLHFANYEDEKIKEKVKDCFKIHLFLPDLRKENIHLEYESSSIHQLINYDMNFRLTCTYNYYSKYINKEYIENGLKILEQEKIKKLSDGKQDTQNNENNKDDQNNQDIKDFKDNKDKKNDGGVKILREGLFFESDLKNYYLTFSRLINNTFYKDLIIKNIINYEYEELDNIYKDTFNKNCINIDFINLILWINHSFILYNNFIYEYLKSMNDDIDEKIFLNEYVNKYNDIVNCGLLLNSNFDNINIIINQFVINYSFFNDVNEKEKINLRLSNSSASTSNPSISSINNDYKNVKFSLYNLFSTIIKNNIYNKLKGDIINKFKLLAFKFTKELFENENKIDTGKEKEKNKNENKKKQNDDSDLKSDNSEINDDMTDDENDLMELLIEKEPTEKETLENFINTEVDYFINWKNANFINHTGLKVTKEYEDIENILINQFTFNLDKNTENEKSLLSSFEIIEKITKCNYNISNLQMNPDSFSLIRRTKKNLMKQCIMVIFQKMLKILPKNFMAHTKMNKKNEIDFSLTQQEITGKTKYSIDLDDLSSKKRLEVCSKVDNEIKNIKTYLEDEIIKPYEKETTKNQYQKIIDEYINYDGINLVLLIKKILWFYYNELGIYEEKDEKVYNILKGKISSSAEGTNNSLINFNKKLSEENLVGPKSDKKF